MIYEDKWQMGEAADASVSPRGALVGVPTQELADVSADEMEVYPPEGWEDSMDFMDSMPPLPPENIVRMPLGDILTSIFIPWTAFVLSLVIFICLYHDHAPIVWTLQILCTLLAVCTVLTGFQVRDAVLMSLGFLSLASIALGAAAGTWLEEEYLQRFWQLYKASSFKMIRPSDEQLPMDSFLRFPDGAMLEEAHSIGYLAKGNSYCVAPIRLAGEAAIKFWAIGKNCCGRRGNFKCGPQPQHAAVIAERPEEIFRRATVQAASIYQVEVAGPQLVTLVEHPSQLLAEIWYESTRVAVMAGLMHLAVCVIAVLTMATATAYGRKLKD